MDGRSLIARFTSTCRYFSSQPRRTACARSRTGHSFLRWSREDAVLVGPFDEPLAEREKTRHLG